MLLSEEGTFWTEHPDFIKNLKRKKNNASSAAATPPNPYLQNPSSYTYGEEGARVRAQSSDHEQERMRYYSHHMPYEDEDRENTGKRREYFVGESLSEADFRKMLV